jgi:hypothetical protein
MRTARPQIALHARQWIPSKPHLPASPKSVPDGACPSSFHIYLRRHQNPYTARPTPPQSRNPSPISPSCEIWPALARLWLELARRSRRQWHSTSTGRAQGAACGVAAEGRERAAFCARGAAGRSCLTSRGISDMTTTTAIGGRAGASALQPCDGEEAAAFARLVGGELDAGSRPSRRSAGPVRLGAGIRAVHGQELRDDGDPRWLFGGSGVRRGGWDRPGYGRAGRQPFVWASRGPT